MSRDRKTIDEYVLESTTGPRGGWQSEGVYTSEYVAEEDLYLLQAENPQISYRIRAIRSPLPVPIDPARLATIKADLKAAGY